MLIQSILNLKYDQFQIEMSGSALILAYFGLWFKSRNRWKMIFHFIEYFYFTHKLKRKFVKLKRTFISWFLIYLERERNAVKIDTVDAKHNDEMLS